jgi:hypothetical protein
MKLKKNKRRLKRIINENGLIEPNAMQVKRL